MALRRGVGLLLLAAALTSTAALAKGQDAKGSHIPIPVPEGGAEKLFEERLRQMDARTADLEKLRHDLDKILGKKGLEKLVDQLKKQKDQPANDGRLGDQLKKYLDGAKGNGSTIDLKPEQIEQLKRLLEKGWPDGQFPELGPLGGLDKKGSDPAKSGVVDPPALPDTSKWGGGPQPGARVDPSTEEARKQLLEWAKRFEDLAGKVEDSPALQQALRDLSRAALDLRNNGGGSDQPIDKQLADLSRLTRDTGGWFRDSWGSLKKLDLPAMPKVKWPSTGLPNAPSLPSVGLPRGFSSVPQPSAAGGKVLLAVVGFGLVAVIAWKIYRLLGRRRRREEAQWQLGPWPLDPATIASREDLVRTFEYLSLLCCGLQARSWNHLQIASEIGSGADDRRQAAAELAALYEQARYTPADEPLTPEALAAARRDLCFLAGVAAV